MSIFLKISKQVGNQRKAAEALGVSTSTYSDWVKEIKKPSIKNTLKIEKLFNIPRDEIRPDIFGINVNKQSQPNHPHV